MVKLTAKQHSALKYIRAAQPLVGQPTSAAPAHVVAVLKRLGLVEDKNTGVGCVVLVPSVTGTMLLIMLARKAKKESTS